jgi:thiol:disulfide interchange protein DsbC
MTTLKRTLPLKTLFATCLFGAIMNFSITDVLAAAKQEPYAKGFDFVELSARDREVLTTLQNAYPDNRVRFARETAVSNFYEVILGSSVSYVFVDREALQQYLKNTTDKSSVTIDEATRNRIFRHWVFGGVFFDMSTGTDLTAPMKKLAQLIDVNALPLDQAIIRTKGVPKNTLYVFTDPLCPFCKKQENLLAQLNNVRIVTFLTPLVSLHPEAREVAARIWCAKDKVKAFEDVMLRNVTLMEKAQCEAPILANEKLMQSLSIKGTPTIVFENGERVTGAMSKEQILEKLKTIESLKNTLDKSFAQTGQ